MRRLNPRQDKTFLRLIDANLNRAREGIRVVEDTLRFIKNDKTHYSELRRLRHSLDRAASAIYPELIDSRLSAEDVGAGAKELPHGNIADVVFANFNRAKESVRVLEEYSRLLPGGSNAVFKKIRFGLYALEKKIGNKYFAA